MKSISLRSPAKLNLFLKVQNKRQDGYHNILTLFERINLFDDIQISRNSVNKIRIYCNHPQVPKGPKNLAFKVAESIRNDFALEDGVDIRITKRIPIAAGLAGGSSNAAATILGLNKIWKLSLTKNEMLKYARKIGADVAFFLHDCAWGLGTERGDQIKTLSIKSKLWHVLVIPRITVYSHKVYEGLDLSKLPTKSHIFGFQKGSNVGKSSKNVGLTNMLTKTDDNVNILIRHLIRNNIKEVGNFLLNDLEYSSFRLCPNLLGLKKRMKKLHPMGAALSGSGPAVYGLTSSKRQAEDLKATLLKRYSQVFVVRTF